ncbi:MAG TPA: poly(R)-hydroxyalkanoic acid synthase subunit PhaE [Steroidobacter sp.]|uniref:poly(R)-hydroxyalkanoic acid synthase subunit PhaE n=1 Tax=Steroidobacter sp. TaxID=1978227 RepID=UPI002ED8FA57
MTESTNDGSDWIQAWIEQQREQLRRAGMPSSSADPATGSASGDKVSDQVRDIGMRWLEAGQAYLQGWQQFAQRSAAGAAAGEPPLKFGEDMLNAWQGAWAGAATAGEGATRQFADLISRLPALGLAREQTEAWRELMAAQAEYHQLEQELRTVWTKVQTDALTMLERLIRERKAQGTEGAVGGVGEYRELYNLWVECGEKVFSQVAHSEPYCKLQAQLGNAAIRLRAGQQAMLERLLKQFDLPTRSELNTVHKQMRELRERVATLEAQLAEARGEERS